MASCALCLSVAVVLLTLTKKCAFGLKPVHDMVLKSPGLFSSCVGYVLSNLRQKQIH